jgi:hypothetical protein
MWIEKSETTRKLRPTSVRKPSSACVERAASSPQHPPNGCRMDGIVGRIPKIRPVQLRISGLVDASTCCRGRWIKDNGVLSPIAL